MPDDVWLIDLDTNRVSSAHKDVVALFPGNRALPSTYPLRI